MWDLAELGDKYLIKTLFTEVEVPASFLYSICQLILTMNRTMAIEVSMTRMPYLLIYPLTSNTTNGKRQHVMGFLLSSAIIVAIVERQYS
jgi:hypothetical protein